MRFCVGVLFGLLIAVVAPFVLLLAGFVDMGARDGSGVPELVLGEWAVDRWVDTQAPAETLEPADPQAAWQQGLTLYARRCVQCHGAPQVDPADWAQAMLPRPPDLSHSNDRLTEAQIAFVTAEGVRMSGMPAYADLHSEEEIRSIARFVREIERVDASQRQRLRQAASGQLQQSQPEIQRYAGNPLESPPAGEVPSADTDEASSTEARGVRGNDPPRFPRTNHAPK